MQIIFLSRFPVIKTSGVKKQFFTELLFALAEKTPNLRFIVISPEFRIDEHQKPNNLEWVKRPAFSVSSRLLERIWKRIQLPRMIKQKNANILLDADGDTFLKINIPQVLFLHGTLLSENKQYKRPVSSISKRNKISSENQIVYLTPSSFHREIFLKTDADKNTSVLYPASLNSSKPIDEISRDDVKQRLTQFCEYFICHSHEHSKENILVLLKAFSLFKKRQKSNMKLVVCGKIAGNNKKFQEELNAYRYREDILLYETISEQEELIAAAYAAIFFNQPHFNSQPLIDSFSLEVPLIAGDHGFYREIIEDSGLFFQEKNHTDLAVQMMMMYKDEDLRSRLIKAVQKRKEIFSLQEAVLKMERVILSFAQNE